jgi:ABC-2 type transport system permease protein
MLSVAILVGVALLMGLRPTADVAGWIVVLGVSALCTLGVTWMGVVFGLLGKTPAGANSLSRSFLLLAFSSSTFVSTQSMPSAVRWYADYQPFIPVSTTLRGLLFGTPIGNSAMLAIAWSLGLALDGYVLARELYKRGSGRSYRYAVQPAGGRNSTQEHQWGCSFMPPAMFPRVALAIGVVVVR